MRVRPITRNGCRTSSTVRSGRAGRHWATPWRCAEMDRTQFDRFFDGIGLGFLVSAGGWIAVIGTMNRDLDTVSFVALWLPVVGFAALGFALHGSGLLGAGRRCGRRRAVRV